MAGLIAGACERIRVSAVPPVRDAALIAGAQKIAQYGIAGYGTVRTFAALLGNDEIVASLQQALMDKLEVDRSLTGLASLVNVGVAELGEN